MFTTSTGKISINLNLVLTVQKRNDGYATIHFIDNTKMSSITVENIDADEIINELNKLKNS